MGDAPAAAVRKPCCVCAEPGGQHCTKCKSRHYCSKACQLVDWKGGHKAACKQLASAFQGRMLVAPADGSKADWCGTCAICMDLLPIKAEMQTLYYCCCKSVCTACADECWQHDTRCPLCRMPAHNSSAEAVRRLQDLVDKGNAAAQTMLGAVYRAGSMGLKKSMKRAFRLFEASAAQGHAPAQKALGHIYERGEGVEVDWKTAALWYRRAAEQGFSDAQYCFGLMNYNGKGMARSPEEAVKWFRLSAAQGDAESWCIIGACYAKGEGVPQDTRESLRCFKRAAAKGHPGALAIVEKAAGADQRWANM